MINAPAICCRTDCPERFSCQKFSRALDVNQGKLKLFEIITCNNFNQYEK